MTLAAIQLSALCLCEHPELMFPGASPGHGNTMNTLKRKGLAQKTLAGWRLTDAGREALGLEPWSLEQWIADETRIQRELRKRWGAARPEENRW